MRRIVYMIRAFHHRGNARARPGRRVAPRQVNEHDAYAAAAWLRQADLDGHLARLLKPELTPPQRTVAGVEGWTLGVG